MGIEQLSGVTGASSYQSQITPAAKPVASTTASDKHGNTVTEVSQSATSNQPVVISAVAESNQSNKDGDALGSGADKMIEQLADKAADKKASEDSGVSMKNMKDIQKLINNNTIAEFSYNEPTKRIAIRIKDKDTDEVIKEIPSEKALEMLAKAWELAGILVDEKR